MTTRLCMIGAGGHAWRNVYPCFPQLKNARVIANADLDLEKAKSLAIPYGIPNSYSDYRAMLEREKPDGVIICVGPDFHARVSVEVMNLGYHVYVEKPPGATLEQVAEMRRVHRETGRICMTALKKRFAPAYVKARALIADDSFGEPCVLNILRTSGNFTHQPGRNAPYLIDNSIHVLDLATFLFGPVKSVAASFKPTANYSITFQFRNGAVGSMALTDRMSYQRGWEEVAAVGSNGVIVQVDNSVEMVAFRHDTPIAAHKPEFVAGSSHSSVEMGFTGELQAFVDAIASGTEPDGSIESTFHTMQIAVAIDEAAATGRTIEIKENAE